MSTKEIDQQLPLRARIERIVPGGLGLARYAGRILLVPMTAPGDLVEIVPDDRGPGARLIQVLEAGADRAVPPCLHYGECGGCDFMHLSYEGQIAAKRAIVIDALRRTGGVDWPHRLEIVPSPIPLGARNRATWQPAPGRTAGYVRRESHAAVRIHACPVLDLALERARLEIRPEHPIRALSNGSELSIALDGSASEIEFRVAGERYWASATAFFQSNVALLEQFVPHVLGAVSGDGVNRVLELYSGIGLFTLAVARQATTVQTVESDPIAYQLALRNLADSGIGNVRAVCDSAERWLAQCRDRFDVVLVDPPRAGLSRSVRASIARLKPQRLIYVTCDPVTFARDVRYFVGTGYNLDHLTGFDMFPQTHHIELVGTLNRVATSGS